MIEQMKLMGESINELKKIMKIQDDIFDLTLKKLPKQEQAKYRKIMSNVKNGKLKITDIQKIINDINCK